MLPEDHWSTARRSLEVMEGEVVSSTGKGNNVHGSVVLLTLAIPPAGAGLATILFFSSSSFLEEVAATEAAGSP